MDKGDSVVLPPPLKKLKGISKPGEQFLIDKIRGSKIETHHKPVAAVTGVRRMSTSQVNRVSHQSKTSVNINATNLELKILEKEVCEESLERKPCMYTECIDLFDDDEEDCNYHDIDPEDMFCEVCDKVFKSKRFFIQHHRRHSASNHFQCPTCFAGFTGLRGCLSHEILVHQKSTNVSKTNKKAQINLRNNEEDANTSKRVLSTSLTMYRGPVVKHMYEAYDVEEKFGRRGRDKNYIALQIEKLKGDCDDELVEDEM